MSLRNLPIIKSFNALRKTGEIYLKSTPFIRSSAVMKSGAKTKDVSSLEIVAENGSVYDSPYLPERGNDLYLESNTTTTINSNISCRDLWLNGEFDVVRVKNPNNCSIDVYGSFLTYNNSYPNANRNGTSNASGVDGWLENMIVTLKGESRSIQTRYTTAQSRTAGWTLISDPGSGKTISIGDGSAIRVGFLEVKSGHLFTPNDNGQDIRIAGYDYVPGDGNLLPNEGTLVVRSGAKYSAFYIRKNNRNVVGQALAKITIESGATLSPVSQNAIFIAREWEFEGTLDINVTKFPTHGGGSFPDAIPIDEVGTLRLSYSAVTTMSNDLNVKYKVLVSSGFLNLERDGYNLTYNQEADLEYDFDFGTRTFDDSVIPPSSSGSSIPRNLIINSGTTLDLNSNTINIRGQVLGSGSFINGAINEFQT